jgi:hypothetical protein
MIAWGKKSDIRQQVANVPENWLDTFAVKQPNDIRKFGSAQNSTLLYRSSAILEAVEQQLYFRNDDAAKKKDDVPAEPGAAKKKGAAA